MTAPAPDTVDSVERERVVEIMQAAWNNFVADTGCYPDDFTIAGRRNSEMTFRAGTWAGQVADAILRELSKARASGEGEAPAGCDDEAS